MVDVYQYNVGPCDQQQRAACSIEFVLVHCLNIILVHVAGIHALVLIQEEDPDTPGHDPAPAQGVEGIFYNFSTDLWKQWLMLVFRCSQVTKLPSA